MACPQVNLWQLPPAEIRIEILKGIPDLPSLRNILIAYPPDCDLYQKYHEEIFASVLEKIPSDIRAIVSQIYSHIKRIIIQQPLWDHYLDRTIPREKRLDDPMEIDHLAVLFELAERAESIEALSQSFAQKRILIPGSQPKVKNRCCSPAEIHRIRRAFWRFQLLYEQETNRKDGSHSGQYPKQALRYLSSRPDHGPDPGSHWLRRTDEPFVPSQPHLDIASWEPAEVNAIRVHLQAEVNHVQYERYHCSSQQASRDILDEQPILIQNLIRDLEHWRVDLIQPRSHILVAEIDWFGSTAAPGLTEFQEIEDRIVRHPDVPRGANRGNLLRELSIGFDIPQEYLVGFHGEWGSSMWDQTRLEACGLLWTNKLGVPFSRMMRSLSPTFWTRSILFFEPFRVMFRRCASRLRDVLDCRVKKLYDADVLAQRGKTKRAEVLKHRYEELTCLGHPDARLLEMWRNQLLEEGWCRSDQDSAECCYWKALLQHFLGYCHAIQRSEFDEAEDLAFLVVYRNRKCISYSAHPICSSVSLENLTM